jgi:hypothetical protein
VQGREGSPELASWLLLGDLVALGLHFLVWLAGLELSSLQDLLKLQGL